MSVYIKGMEMPEICGVCRFFVNLDASYGSGGFYCAAAEKFHDGSAADRKKICPLIKLPPHGRLIDADALKRSVYDYADAIGISNMFYFDEVIQSAFENAQTIIPAEEGE